MVNVAALSVSLTNGEDLMLFGKDHQFLIYDTRSTGRDHQFKIYFPQTIDTTCM